MRAVRGGRGVGSLAVHTSFVSRFIQCEAGGGAAGDALSSSTMSRSVTVRWRVSRPSPLTADAASGAGTTSLPTDDVAAATDAKASEA